jgi:hypothetical protein
MTELKLLGKDERRAKRDRLEVLTALMDVPGFDPLYRTDLIFLPPQHPIFGWECVVDGCERVRLQATKLCQAHRRQWREAQKAGSSRAAFLAAAVPYQPTEGIPSAHCLVCPDRPTTHRSMPLCKSHDNRWRQAGQPRGKALEEWLATQTPFPGFGECRCEVCPDPAAAWWASAITTCAITGRRGRRAMRGRRRLAGTILPARSSTPTGRRSRSGARRRPRLTGSA